MHLGLGESLIVLVIVLLVFGVGRISQVAKELGRSVRAFREGLQEEDASPHQQSEDGQDNDSPS